MVTKCTKNIENVLILTKVEGIMKDPKDMSWNELIAELGRRSSALKMLLHPEGRKKSINQATEFNLAYCVASSNYASFCDGRLENDQ